MGGVEVCQTPELSGRQGDTLLGFSVREISSGRMGAFGLFGVQRFSSAHELWIRRNRRLSREEPCGSIGSFA